jgi:hypothetical protein
MKTSVAISVLCLAWAGQASAQLFHITENSTTETLSTDIPDAVITTTPTIPGAAGEQWTITLGGGYTFSGALNNGFNIGEPESPTGAKINFFASLPSWYAGSPNPPPYSASVGYWISDTWNPSEFTFPMPNPVTALGLVLDGSGAPHDVILADTPGSSTAPDGGLTIAMLGLGMTGLAFIRRKFQG